MPASAVAYAEDTGDREYLEKTDYFGAYQPVFSAKDISSAMERAIDLRGTVSFTPKTWEEVLRPLVEELKVLPPPKMLTAEDRQETVVPMLDG
jgi:hypothetical protein